MIVPYCFNSTGFSPRAKRGFLGSLINSLELADRLATLPKVQYMMAPPTKNGQYGFKIGVENLLSIID